MEGVKVHDQFVVELAVGDEGALSQCVCRDEERQEAGVRGGIKAMKRVESLRGCAPLAIAHLDIILPRIPIRLRDPLPYLQRTA